jgi:ribonuclease P protein component
VNFTEYIRLVGEPGSAFGSAAFKNVAAGLVSHAFHKAVFAAALSFFRLISSLRHELYLNINPYQLSTRNYKLLAMISRAHRFHGYNTMRHVYKYGAVSRGSLFAVKALPNEKRQNYRVAVVVSRKINKSAVARNRMRRRIYEQVRQLANSIDHPFDIVITVFSNNLLDATPKELESVLKKQFRQAGIIGKKAR